MIGSFLPHRKNSDTPQDMSALIGVFKNKIKMILVSFEPICAAWTPKARMHHFLSVVCHPSQGYTLVYAWRSTYAVHASRATCANF